MQKFKGDFLSVRTPKTTDGILPKIVDGKQQYKTTSLPMTAKKHLERINKKLPDHLKMTWEVMRNEPVAVIASKEIKESPKRSLFSSNQVNEVIDKNKENFSQEGCNCRSTGCLKFYCHCLRAGKTAGIVDPHS